MKYLVKILIFKKKYGLSSNVKLVNKIQVKRNSIPFVDNSPEVGTNNKLIGS